MKRKTRRHRLKLEITDRLGCNTQGEVVSMIKDFIRTGIEIETAKGWLKPNRFGDIKVQDYNRSLVYKIAKLKERYRAKQE